MTFDNSNIKPVLIEPKIFKYYNKKIKSKEFKEKNKQQQQQQQQQQQIQNIQLIQHNKWYNKIYENIWKFIKNNYGFFLIIILINTLLYIRYIEVKSRKKKMKDIIEKINKEKEIQQFIELQNLNKQLSQYD
jgi:hypothetical protein